MNILLYLAKGLRWCNWGYRPSKGMIILDYSGRPSLIIRSKNVTQLQSKEDVAMEGWERGSRRKVAISQGMCTKARKRIQLESLQKRMQPSWFLDFSLRRPKLEFGLTELYDNKFVISLILLGCSKPLKFVVLCYSSNRKPIQAHSRKSNSMKYPYSIWKHCNMCRNHFWMNRRLRSGKALYK